MVQATSRTRCSAEKTRTGFLYLQRANHSAWVDNIEIGGKNDHCITWSIVTRKKCYTSLYLCSSGSDARGESRALEGRRVSSKSPSRVRDRDEGVAGRNGREKYFPSEESLIFPPGKSMIFYKKVTDKNWVGGLTCTTTDTESAAAAAEGGSFMLVRQEEDDYDTKGFTGKENDSMMSIYFEQGIDCNLWRTS